MQNYFTAPFANKDLKGIAKAQWIRLLLQACGPRFESQARLWRRFHR